MIKKLKTKIFLLIMISLSVLVLGIIITFSILNYRNTIITATSVMDRFFGIEDRGRNFEDKGVKKDDIPVPLFENELDGVYYITVENSKVVNNSEEEIDSQIEEYALKVSNTNKENGIVDKYVYKVRRTKDNSCLVILMENENVILHIRIIMISAVVGSISALILIYIISKRISEIIVKPVEDTLEKQKQFISDASHELKTPLAVIEANADVLENETGENKWLGYIQNEVDSMNKLVNELLLLAKMENTDNVRTYEKFNVSDEVEIVVSMFESMAFEKNVKIKSDIQENIVMDGNKEDIEHILSTLVDNAIKHTEKEKDVIVELKKDKSNIIIKVKNVGDRIPDKEKEKIFERFYRVDKSRNRNEKRYGLGLAIAKSAVEKYKGKIEVQYEDIYNVFKVVIPV